MGVEEEQIRILRKQNWQARQKIGTLEKEVERQTMFTSAAEGIVGDMFKDVHRKWLPLLAAAKDVDRVADEILGVEHQLCNKPPCSGCEFDEATDVLKEVIAACEENT